MAGGKGEFRLICKDRSSEISSSCFRNKIKNNLFEVILSQDRSLRASKENNRCVANFQLGISPGDAAIKAIHQE